MRKYEGAMKKPQSPRGQRYVRVKLSRFRVYLWKDKFISWPVGPAASYSPRECTWITWIYVMRMRRLASRMHESSPFENGVPKMCDFFYLSSILLCDNFAALPSSFNKNFNGTDAKKLERLFYESRCMDAKIAIDRFTWQSLFASNVPHARQWSKVHPYNMISMKIPFATMNRGSAVHRGMTDTRQVTAYITDAKG